MAKRISGSVTVRIKFDDASGAYVARVTAPGVSGETVRVLPPAILTRAVDHPKSYDEAARAAVCFAGDDFLPLAFTDDTGLVVVRRSAR